MKKLLVPFFLIILLALAVLPAAAGNGPGGGGSGPMGPQVTPQPEPLGQGTMTTFRQSSPKGVIAVTGLISALDATTKTITVTVLHGSKLAQAYINTDVVFLTVETTKYMYKVDRTTPATIITFEDLVVGDTVSVRAILTEDVLTAFHVTKGAQLKCMP